MPRVVNGTDILVVVPPFASAECPALGASLLVASCRRRGLDAKVLYGSLMLAARIGFETYTDLAYSSALALAGEAVFRAAAFPDAFRASDQPGLIREQTCVPAIKSKCHSTPKKYTSLIALARKISPPPRMSRVKLYLNQTSLKGKAKMSFPLFLLTTPIFTHFPN